MVKPAPAGLIQQHFICSLVAFYQLHRPVGEMRIRATKPPRDVYAAKNSHEALPVRPKPAMDRGMGVAQRVHGGKIDRAYGE
jgi:hypothetical protein